MTVADNYIEMMARAAAFDYVCYIGEFGAYNTMSDSEQRDYWDETFDDIVDLDVPLSSAWCYDRVGGTGINILSDNTNSWILDEMALATRALNSPAWTNQDIGTVTTVGWTTDNWRNGEKWIRNASGSVFSGSESGHFMSLKDGLAGDGVITARLSSQSNTCEWAKAGLMIRQDMTSNGRDASLMVASYAPSGGRIYFSRRNTPGSNTVSDIGCGVTAPEWLRLRKVGSSFDAYYKATEGADWTQLGSVVSIPGITTDNEIGLFACSQASSGTFVSFGSVDVQSWSTHAIGISATNAKASLDSTNGFYLVGCGSFSSTNDACSYYSIDGGFNQDAEVVVEVTGVDNASEWACAGIMFRDGFGAGAKHVAVVTAPNAPNSGRTYFKRRLVTGDTHEQDLVAGTGSSRWLKLCREGNLFSAYQSADGNTWTQIGSEEFVSMPAHLEIGLVVVSYATSTTRGFFDHLEVRKLDVYSE
jgi:hypothetical protein